MLQKWIAVIAVNMLLSNLCAQSNSYQMAMLNLEAITPQQSDTLSKPPAVWIFSTPDEARVYINGNFRGITPLNLIDVSDENVRVTICKEYFQDWQQDLNLVARNDQILSAVLQNEMGHIEIATSPQGMDVSLDGKYIGTTPLNCKIAYGEYDLSIYKVGYKTQNVKMVVDQALIKRFMFMTTQIATLQITDITDGSKIEIGGKEADGAGTYHLQEGSHKVNIVRFGYEDLTTTIHLQSGQTTVLNGRLSPKGTEAAVWRSMLLPGWGQAYQEKSVQKWLYPVLFLGGAGAAYWSVQQYNQAVRDYNEIRRHYMEAYAASEIEGLKNEMDTDWEDVQSAKQLRNTLFLFTGGVWLINVLDTMILPPAWNGNMTVQASMDGDVTWTGLSLWF